MKLFSIFMLVFTLGGFASGYSQKQVVTLNLKQCDVNTLLQEIWKQTGLRFVYNEQDVAQLKRFDVNAQQKQVDEILDHIFKNTPYQCAYESDVIYITPRPVGDLPQVKQERVKLSGNIKDKNGNVLPGVTVFIGNSDIGTSSDINGNYQLAILKGNAVEIVYSFIGMKKVTYNFPATEDVRHNVVMEEDQVELQDVVVIGYGSKSARNLTSSVSSVKAKDLEKYANGATTFDNMLGGAVKGVLVNQNSGEPGAKATLNIRGITSPLKSQNNNEPLYVVDGVPFFVERSLKAVCSCGNTQYASAVIVVNTITELGTGMIDAHTISLTLCIQSADWQTLAVGFWITAACDNDTGSLLIREMNHIFGQCSIVYCFHDFNQIAVQQFQNNLSFRIAKTAVILNDVWTLWCQHQTKVQTTFKWSAQFLHCCNGWFEDLVHTFLCNFFGIEWIWCNCTHTAGVKTLIPVQSTFVVHRRNHRNNSFSIHKCQNRNFRSGQEFFHNNMVAAGTEYLFFHDKKNPDALSQSCQ